MSPPTTWEQLESDAKTLVSKALVKYGFVWQGASYEGLTCNFMEYLASAGGTATNSGYTKATPGLAGGDQGGHLHAQPDHLRGHPGGGHHVPGAAGDEHLRGRQLRVPAELGLRLLRRHHPGHGGKLTASQVGVEPMPAFAGQPTPGYSNIGGWNMYINPHSKNIAADLTFIKFLASPHGADHPGDRVLRDPHHQRGADARHGHRAEPGAGHRAARPSWSRGPRARLTTRR